METELLHYIYTDYQLSQLVKHAYKVGCEVYDNGNGLYAFRLVNPRYEYGQLVRAEKAPFAIISFRNHTVSFNTRFSDPCNRYEICKFELLPLENIRKFIADFDRAAAKSEAWQERQKVILKDKERQAIMED